MAEQKKKGRVFVTTDTGKIVPFTKLRQAEIKKDSKQAEQVPKWLAQMQLIPPPYTPESFLQLYESNPIFFRCVNQLATDVAGLGWKLKLREGKEESKNERERLQALLDRSR